MNNPHVNPNADTAADHGSVEMPSPTVAPLVLSVGIALAAAGVAIGWAFLVVGLVLFCAGLGMWIGQLLPGRGHEHEPLVEPALRPRAVVAATGAVERLGPGMPGHRLRLPVKMHPISAGIKGGIVGGLLMPIPAMLYGLLSGHGIWYPVNLLAGMVLPGIDAMTVEELEQFSPLLVALAVVIHISVSLLIGLIYGVLLPTLPDVAKPLAWGALLMPLLWTTVSFGLVSSLSPVVRERIDWPWFVVSQFVFGVVAAIGVLMAGRRHALIGGIWGGVIGGLLMPVPALLWGLLTRHGIWYPVNLLASMALPQAADLSVDQLEQFHGNWLAAAVVLHVALSLVFGTVYGLALAKLPEMPAAFVWGGLVMPMLWTATSYGLMGIVNPALQERVDWPWFILSQFVFGLVAAVVVVRSEMVYNAPAGHGPDGRTDSERPTP